MGRKRKSGDELQSAWIQFRCTPSFKARVVGLKETEGHGSLTEMFEAWVKLAEKRRRRKKSHAPG